MILIATTRPLEKDELKSLVDDFHVGFIDSHIALEGNTLNISETKILLEEGITIGGHPLIDCYEAFGHGDAYDLTLKLA